MILSKGHGRGDQGDEEKCAIKYLKKRSFLPLEGLGPCFLFTVRSPDLNGLYLPPHSKKQSKRSLTAKNLRQVYRSENCPDVCTLCPLGKILRRRVRRGDHCSNTGEGPCMIFKRQRNPRVWRRATEFLCLLCATAWGLDKLLEQNTPSRYTNISIWPRFQTQAITCAFCVRKF